MPLLPVGCGRARVVGSVRWLAPCEHDLPSCSTDEHLFAAPTISRAQSHPPFLAVVCARCNRRRPRIHRGQGHRAIRTRPRGSCRWPRRHLCQCHPCAAVELDSTRTTSLDSRWLSDWILRGRDSRQPNTQRADWPSAEHLPYRHWCSVRRRDASQPCHSALAIANSTRFSRLLVQNSMHTPSSA